MLIFLAPIFWLGLDENALVDSLVFRLTYHSTVDEDPANPPGEEEGARTLYCTASASTVFTIYTQPSEPDVAAQAATRVVITEMPDGSIVERDEAISVLRAI